MLFTSTVLAPNAKHPRAPERQATAPYAVVTCGIMSRNPAAPAKPAARRRRRTRVTAVPSRMSLSASHPATSPEAIIARFGTADAKPLPLREKPCAWIRYVGIHEYMNQAVQLVTNVV